MSICKQFSQVLREHAEPSTKEWFEKYCKGQEQFLGLKTPAVERLLKEFLPNIPTDKYVHFAEALLWEPHAEQFLSGIIILQRYLIPKHKIEAEQVLGLCERLFCEGRIRWWNTCDWLCIRVLSRLIQRDGQSVGASIAEWKDSDYLWQKRAALVSFVSHAKKPSYPGCLEHILSVARHLVRSNERFHQTAVGWVMREVGKSDKGDVQILQDFLQRELRYFSAEGLRYATEKLPRDVVLELRRQHKLSK